MLTMEEIRKKANNRTINKVKNYKSETEESEIYEKNLILENISEEMRNLLILIKKEEEYKNKKYLKLVVLDIFSGIIIQLCNNNGEDRGMVFYKDNNEPLCKLSEGMVVKVGLKIAKSPSVLNIYRVSSEYEYLGEINIRHNIRDINKKYSCRAINKSIESSFKQIEDLAFNNVNTRFYALAHFSSCEFRNGKICMIGKERRYFIPVTDLTVNLFKENENVKGLALLSVIFYDDQGEKYKINAEKIFFTSAKSRAKGEKEIVTDEIDISKPRKIISWMASAPDEDFDDYEEDYQDYTLYDEEYGGERYLIQNSFDDGFIFDLKPSNELIKIRSEFNIINEYIKISPETIDNLYNSIINIKNIELPFKLNRSICKFWEENGFIAKDHRRYKEYIVYQEENSEMKITIRVGDEGRILIYKTENEMFRDYISASFETSLMCDNFVNTKEILVDTICDRYLILREMIENIYFFITGKSPIGDLSNLY